MNYLQINTMRNLIAAGMMIVTGYCLQWLGMATIAERVNSTLQTLLLVAYEWTGSQAVMVQMVYQVDIWWWSCFAAINLSWVVASLLVVAGLYRFISVRLAGIATIAVIVATFSFGSPLRLTEAFWESASGNPSPMAASETQNATTDVKLTETATKDAEFKVPGNLWTSSDASLPMGLIGYGFAGGAVLYNTVRLVLIPTIIISISLVLIGSVRRKQAI